VQPNTTDDVLTEATLTAVRRIDVAINQRDLAGVMEVMSDDTVWENTFPAPDGERYEGYAAVRAAFERFFHDSPHAAFDIEETYACGERAIVRWRYNWVESNGAPGHIRGVDLLRVRDGKVVECFSYVKG
jgi:ketosteroid isomerase-like protein